MKPINDPVLGVLEPYMEGGEFCNWEGKITLQNFTEPIIFWVGNGDVNFMITENHRNAFKNFVEHHQHYKTETLSAIYKMLMKHYEEFGITEFEEFREAFDKVKSPADLDQFLSDPHLYLFESEEDILMFGLGFWGWHFDEEHGVGVKFENGKSVMVGDLGTAQNEFWGYKVDEL
jgi:hypothetical protein